MLGLTMGCNNKSVAGDLVKKTVWGKEMNACGLGRGHQTEAKQSNIIHANLARKRQICGCTMHTHTPVITNEVNIASRSSVCIFDKRKFLSGGGVGRKEDEGFAIARIKHVDLRRV